MTDTKSDPKAAAVAAPEPPIQEFPKLMWTAEGQERTVQSKAEEDARLKDGWRLTAEAQPAAQAAAPPAPAEPVSTEPPAESDDTTSKRRR